MVAQQIKKLYIVFFLRFFLSSIFSLTGNFVLFDQSTHERLKLGIVYFDTRGQNGRLAHYECENAVKFEQFEQIDIGRKF